MDEPTNWSRRGFLTARGLGASAGGFLGALLASTPQPPPSSGTRTHLCFSRRAMACEFTLFLPHTVGSPMAASDTALDQIDRLESLLTVYRDDSDMSYVNQNAAFRPIRTDHRLFVLLRRCRELSEQTAGAFDVSAGALVKAWGFLRGPRRVPDPREVRDALARTGMQQVVLDEQETTVRYLVDGLEINLGSIGKGFALDQALALLRQEFGIDCALMQGGLSSVVTMGSPGGDGRGWLVGIQDPHDAATQIAEVRLKDQALGTSGTANQYFEENGRRYGHILDPRTGYPADELASVSVIAGDGATADALATALFVMGLDKAVDFCKNHRDVGAVLVLKKDPTLPVNTPPRIRVMNIPKGDVNLRPVPVVPVPDWWKGDPHVS